MRKTVIIGIGNPVLTDDAVGVQVSRRLAEVFKGRPDIQVAEIHTGGISLMEAMVGYERAILVDAMECGQKPGTVYRVTDMALMESKNSACAHNTSLNVALNVGRLVGLPLPCSIEIWGVEPQDLNSFGEQLTELVAQSVPYVVDSVLKTLASS